MAGVHLRRCDSIREAALNTADTDTLITRCLGNKSNNISIACKTLKLSFGYLWGLTIIESGPMRHGINLVQLMFGFHQIHE